MIRLKEIPGLPSHIKAGDDGQIYNTKTNKILGSGGKSVGVNGYCKIFINHKAYLKHRLIALAWIPNPANLPEVNHIDGNKTNCKPSNLEWCSSSHNSQHAHDNGLRKYDIPVIMCDSITQKEIMRFPHTQAAQTYLGRPGKHGIWEAINNDSSKRLNGCAYGYFWKRDLNGENTSCE